MKTRPFAVFDIDGTLIRWQLLHAMIDALGRAGHITAKDYELIRQTRLNWKTRKTEEGFREYEAQLVHVIQRSIDGIEVKAFNDAAKAAFDEYKDQVYRYTRQLLTDLRARGYLLLAVSGSPQEAVAPVADYYGFDDFVGSDYRQKDGKFTGEIQVAALNKPQLLKELVAKHKLSHKGSLGLGDSEGDIDMLDMVEEAIAFNPSKELFRQATRRGWKVVIERKNMIYELTQRNGEYRLTHTNAEG